MNDLDKIIISERLDNPNFTFSNLQTYHKWNRMVESKNYCSMIYYLLENAIASKSDLYNCFSGVNWEYYMKIKILSHYC